MAGRRGGVGYLFPIALFQRELERGTGRLPSDETVRRGLIGSATSGSGHARSWIPTRSVRKPRHIRRQVLGLPGRRILLAEDETDLMLLPPLRAGWSLRGEPAEVHISGRNARRVIFGAMNLMTGTRLLLPRPKGRAGDFQAFLEKVRWHYRGWHVALLLNENPSHTAKASLRAAEGLTLLWLPKRSPELNPMETLGGQAQDVVDANKSYETIEEQVDRFLKTLEQPVWARGVAYLRRPLR
jgi:DDE superfamily endonuclease